MKNTISLQAIDRKRTEVANIHPFPPNASCPIHGCNTTQHKPTSTCRQASSKVDVSPKIGVSFFVEFCRWVDPSSNDHLPGELD